MRILFLLLFPLYTLFAEGSVKHVTINENDFSIITENYDIYDSKGTIMKWYYEARDNNLLHRLSFTLKDSTGGCSAKSIENGHYEIKGNTITLYTFWKRQGRVYDVPYGARIMQYEVTKSGKLKLLSSRLYVETTKKSFDKESGIRFLWETPKTQKDQKDFEAYIHSAQQQYKGTFVLGDEAKALMEEVQSALDRKMEKRWQ